MPPLALQELEVIELITPCCILYVSTLHGIVHGGGSCFDFKIVPPVSLEQSRGGCTPNYDCFYKHEASEMKGRPNRFFSLFLISFLYVFITCVSNLGASKSSILLYHSVCTPHALSKKIKGRSSGSQQGRNLNGRSPVGVSQRLVSGAQCPWQHSRCW